MVLFLYSMLWSVLSLSLVLAQETHNSPLQYSDPFARWRDDALTSGSIRCLLQYLATQRISKRITFGYFRAYYSKQGLLQVDVKVICSLPMSHEMSYVGLRV